jgi:hypothetical protein
MTKVAIYPQNFTVGSLESERPFFSSLSQNQRRLTSGAKQNCLMALSHTSHGTGAGLRARSS